MPEQRYEANRRTLGSLLSTTSSRIEVPEWQRSYSWGTEQIESFWQDIIAFDKQYPSGNISQQEYFLGSIVLVTGGQSDILLDGQQRLATATILLSVLRDALGVYKANAATNLQNKYITDYNFATDKTTHVLTLNLYDREFFRAEIQDETSDQGTKPRPTLKSHGLIRKARRYFSKRVREESDKHGGGRGAFKRHLRLVEVVSDHMSVVAVTSTDEDNAASVFETLNDRGIGLSTPDLLRNLLLRRSRDDDSRNRIVGAWGTVLRLGENKISVDEFLRHYWVSQRGDVKTRKLYREIRSKVVKEKMDSLRLSLDLAGAVPIYADIATARDVNRELQTLLADVSALGAKSLYPVLLAAYSVAGDRADRDVILRELTRALISLYVRHTVIGGRESTVLETALYSMAVELRRTGDFQAAVSECAQLAGTADSFVRQFSRASVSRAQTARYLLREIEHAMRATPEMVVAGSDKVHLEHIYSRTPIGDKWRDHDRVINRIGNLTLLHDRLNEKIRNTDFATKKAEAYGDSELLITRELLDYEEWSVETIAERQGRLGQRAFEIWKFAGEKTPSIGLRDNGGAAAVDELEGEDVEMSELPEVPS